jgi:uncharacterized Zn finger protein (UPF0148 family)
MSEGWTGRRCPQCDGTGRSHDGVVTCPACGGCGQEWGELDEPDRRIEEPPRDAQSPMAKVQSERAKAVGIRRRN